MKLDEQIDLVVLDATGLLWRSYHAYPALKSGGNEATGALFGVLNGMLRAYRRFPRAATVLVWDGGGITWRHRLYPDYKANRKGQIKNFERQLVERQRDQVMELLTGLGFQQFRMVGVEADDVIGLLVRVAQRNQPQKKIVVWSGDKDFNQLLERDRVYRLPETKGQLYKEQQLSVDFGLSDARLWPQLRALAGDPVDNIKGLPGVGMKTAAKWIRAGLRLDLIDPMEGVRTLPNAAVEKLTQHREQLLLWYQLSRLPWRTDELFEVADDPRKHELQQWLGRTIRHPERTMKCSVDMRHQLWDFCGRFSLQTIRERREEFWKMN